MKKILIIESEEEIRVVYTESRADGFEVVEAKNAVETVDNIIRERLSLQLLDRDLSDIHGEGFIEVSQGDDPEGKTLIVSVYLTVDKQSIQRRI